MGGSCALCTCLNTTTADASAAASAVNYKRRPPAGVCPVSQGVPLALSPLFSRKLIRPNGFFFCFRRTPSLDIQPAAGKINRFPYCGSDVA